MAALPLTFALLLAAPAKSQVDAPPPSPRVEPSALEGRPQVKDLCDALTPEERFDARGDAVERAQAEEAHEARREAALSGRYQVTVPGDRLRFATYDREERRLVLSNRAWLVAAGGSLRLWTVEEVGLPVLADEPAARRIVQALARRTLALVVTFVLPEDDDAAVCSHAAGAHSYTLSVEPVAWQYVEKGVVLARGGEGSERPLLTAAEGARPRVEVANPVGGARAVEGAVRARASDLEGCYRRALQADPGLDGSLVADVDLDASGARREIRMALDSVQDEGLASCVRGVLAGVQFPSGQAGRSTIPIHFTLDPPAAGGEGAGSR